MPRHLVLISQVISKGLKLDTKAWDKLYFGIRQDIKQGIRHGLAGGSVAGTFIEEDGTGSDSGQIPSGDAPTSRGKYKAYSGVSDSRSSKSHYRTKFGKRRGQSCSCKYKRSRYR